MVIITTRFEPQNHVTFFVLLGVGCLERVPHTLDHQYFARLCVMCVYSSVLGVERLEPVQHSGTPIFCISSGMCDVCVQLTIRCGAFGACTAHWNTNILHIYVHVQLTIRCGAFGA